MALRDILASFSINVDKSQVKGGKDAVDGLTKTLSQLGTILTGAAIVGGVKSFVTGMADAADQINDTSAQLGLATTEFQQWSLAAKLSGAEAADFGTSIKILQKNIAESAKGGAETGGKFKELGVALRDSNGNMRETTDILGAVGIQISKMPDAASRTAAALEIFGKSGTKLLPMFAKGEEGLQDLLGELEKLGGGYSEDALEKMGEMGDNLDRWEVATASLKGQLASGLFPIFNSWLSKVLQATGALSKNKEAMEHVKVAFVTLGTVAAIAGLKALAPWLPLMIGLALLVLVVDDLWTAFNGGDSVTTRLLDKLFGKGTGESVFKTIRAEWDDLQKAMKTNNTGLVEEAFSRMGARIVKELMQISTDVEEFREFLAKDIASWALGSEVGNALVKAVKDAPGVVMAYVESNIANFSAIGTRIVDGIKKGLTDAAKSLPDALTEPLKNLVKVADAAIDKGSPARKFIPTGASIPQGLALGMSQETPFALAQMRNTVGQIHSAAAPARNVAYASNTQNQIVVHGIGAEAVKRGVLDAAEEERRATLAALEATA